MNAAVTSRTGAASTTPAQDLPATLTKQKDTTMLPKRHLSPKVADRIGHTLSAIMIAVLSASSLAIIVGIIITPTAGTIA